MYCIVVVLGGRNSNLSLRGSELLHVHGCLNAVGFHENGVTLTLIE